MLNIKEPCFEANCVFGWLNVNLGMTLTGYSYMAWIIKDNKIIWACAITKGNHEVFIDHYSTNPSWFNRTIFNQIMSFCFSHAGRISAQIAEDNTKSLNFADRIGFKQEGIIRKSFDGKKNTIYLGLLKEEYQQSKFYKE